MFFEQKIAFYIWNVFSPILLVFGTIGNVLTIIVLMQRRNRNSNIAKYLTGLAISDLLVLWTAVPNNLLHHGYGIELRSVSPLICKVQIYFIHLGLLCSNSCIVILTVERFICTWLPMKAKRVLTARNANIVIFSLLTFFIVLPAHFLYGMGHTEENICYPIGDSYARFFFHIWPLIIRAICLIQLTLMMVGNISIIIRVLIVRRKTQTQVIPQALTTAARARETQNNRLTAMLITLNVVYMICVIPYTMFTTVRAGWVLSHGNEHSDAVLELIWAILNALFYTNNAINFILYFLGGSAFRKEVTKLLYPILHSCRSLCKTRVHSLENIVDARPVEENIEQ